MSFSKKINYNNSVQAPIDYLQPVHEAITSAGGFVLRSRTLELRIRIDKTRFAKSRGIMKLKCLAKINQFPSATREKIAKVVIMSGDDLMNQKLMNYWRNSS